MERERGFWIVLVSVTLIYAGYLAYAGGLFGASGRDAGGGKASSDPLDVRAFMLQNSVVVNTSLMINERQLEFNRLQDGLRSELSGDVNWSGGMGKAFEVLEADRKIIGELISLTEGEDSEIGNLAVIGGRLTGNEGEVASRMVLNLKKQNQFKRMYFNEVSLMLNATERNMRIMVDGKDSGLERLDDSKAKEYWVMQESHMRAAEEAAEELKSLV
jgi:hypothetical protein